MEQSLQNQALKLWEKGFNIIPLGGFKEEVPEWFIKRNDGVPPEEIKEKWCKTPRIKWKDYQESPASEEQIKKWWSRHPRANIGIITEELAVIDADNQEAVEWCYSNVCSPVRATTAKGRHFYFRNNPELNIRNSSDEKRKLDIRAGGGYVVGAGSIHGTGAKYQWDIEPVFDFRTLEELPIITLETWKKIERYLEKGKKADTSKPKRNINDKPKKGERNDALSRQIGIWINQGDTKEQAQGRAYEWNNRLSKPLPEEEVKRTVESVFKTAAGKRKVLADHVLKESKALDNFDFPRLPSLLEDYIKESGSITDANPVIILMSFLASFSAYIRHKAYLSAINPDTKNHQWRGDLHPNIWTLAISKSGQFKTTALNIGAEILLEKEKDILKKIAEHEDDDKKAKWEKRANLLPTKGSCEGLFDHIKRTKGGLVSSSEFGGWLSNMEASYNASLKPNLTNWFDVPDFDSETTRKRGGVILQKPYISIAGVSTPQWIKSNMNVEKEIASGFFARFLIFCPPESHKRPAALPSKFKTNPKLKEQILKVFDFFDQRTTENPLLFRLDANSEQFYDQCHNEIYDFWESLEKDTQELLEPYVKRWSPYVLKLAMLTQPFIDLESDIISAEALKSAYHIVKYAAKSTVWTVENELTTSSFQEKAEKILKYIASKDGELHRHKLIASKQLKGGRKEYDYVTDFLKESGKLEETGKGKMERLYRLTKI